MREPLRPIDASTLAPAKQPSLAGGECGEDEGTGGGAGEESGPELTGGTTRDNNRRDGNTRTDKRRGADRRDAPPPERGWLHGKTPAAGKTAG